MEPENRVLCPQSKGTKEKEPIPYTLTFAHSIPSRYALRPTRWESRRNVLGPNLLTMYVVEALLLVSSVEEKVEGEHLYWAS